MTTSKTTSLRLATLLATILLLLAPGLKAVAQPTHVVLTDADERLRCGAGTAYYPVSQPAVGTVLAVRDQTDNGWFEVAYPSTVDAIVPAAKATIANDGAVVLTQPDRLLALHATLGPAASWAKLLPEPLPAGTRLFQGRGGEAREGERWIRVKAPSSATGFIRVNAVRPASRAEINEFLNPTPKPAPAPIPEAEAEQPKPAIVVPVPVAVPDESSAVTPEPAIDANESPEAVQAETTEPEATQPEPMESTATPEPTTPSVQTPTTNPFAPPAAEQSTPTTNPFAPAPERQRPANAQPARERPTTAPTQQTQTPATQANPFAPRDGASPAGSRPGVVPNPNSDLARRTPETTTAPAPTPEATPAPAPEPELITPAELDRLFSAVRTQPTLQAEFDQLITQYDRTLAAIAAGTADFDTDETTRETLKTQRTLLEIRKTIQTERLDNIIAAREGAATRQAAESETERFIATQPFDVVGRLQRSVVYDGGSLPMLFRVVSIVPGEQGLALAYIQDTPELSLSSLIGRTVGLRGDFQPFAGGAVRLLQATSVQTVDPSDVRTVPSTNR